MRGQTTGHSQQSRALLWTARIMGTLIILFLVMMVIGYAVNPNGNLPLTDEIFLLALFPIGMCIGYLLAWKWPLAGGIVGTASIVVFLIASRDADMIATLAFLSIPGVLFVVYGVLSRRLGTAPSTE